jgi:hypothetical protein
MTALGSDPAQRLNGITGMVSQRPVLVPLDLGAMSAPRLPTLVQAGASKLIWWCFWPDTLLVRGHSPPTSLNLGMLLAVVEVTITHFKATDFPIWGKAKTYSMLAFLPADSWESQCPTSILAISPRLRFPDADYVFFVTCHDAVLDTFVIRLRG